jgi:AraC family transcriptional regulator, regulatory protein of adaptative response / methylated-DNA-[protein]-cysteine methyltransferase
MNTSMVDTSQMAEDYKRIEQAIRYLEAYHERQPSLREVAESVALSEYHFQRLFTRWVGISPKRFLQYLTKEHVKALLAQSSDLLTVTYQAGLSSPGRLHDLFVNAEAVTPGEFKSRGEGLEIVYGIHPTPFGECLLAATERGISNLIFLADGSPQGAVAELRKAWGRANLREDALRTQAAAQQVTQALMGASELPLALHLRGTNFQLKVWEALLQVPEGAVVSYDELAAWIGEPGAARAVGNAVGRNPIPLLIPCHRVIRKSGDFGGYRWGLPRKKAILGWEMAKTSKAVEWTSA